MGAKQLNPVSIMCELTQSQIEHLVGYVADNLPLRLDELSDIDEPMFSGIVRLCVDFDVDGQGNVEIAEAEVLNKDWDVMPADSFALHHYLQAEVVDFNRRRKELINGSEAMRSEHCRWRHF